MNSPPESLGECLHFGPFELDTKAGELRKNGLLIRLQEQPLRLLVCLLDRPGAVVSRQELIKRIWPEGTFVDYDHGLNAAAARLRQVLRDSAENPRYIETVSGKGYRFVAHIERPTPVTTPAVAPVAGARPATVSLPSPESHIRPPDEITGPSATAPSDVPVEKRFAASRLLVLLTGAALLAAIAVGIGLYRKSDKTTSQPGIRSLAVLPLKNLSGDARQEYLADGITEEIIGRLAAIHDLRVISRTSAMRFKDTKLSMPEIANTLRVDALVEGSVLREGSRIRIHAQLIRGAADDHFWSQIYDREMRDVLALESEVAQAIAEKVAVTVTGEEHSRLVAVRHVSPEVYESYLKGQFGSRNNRAELEKSITQFEDAIRTDATFAPAYLGLASAYEALNTAFVGAPPFEMRPKVIRAAQTALKLDPELAEAHVVLGDVYQRQWKWSDAKAEYNRALHWKPNDSAAHLGFAKWLLCQGRTEEALSWAQRARELDPLGDASIDIGWILFHARRYDEAIREMRSVLAVHPDSGMTHFDLGFALIGKGDPEEAIRELERATSMTQRSPALLGLLAAAYAHAGRRTEALRIINELNRRRKAAYVPAAAFVQAFLGLHDYNEAFSWLERAYIDQENILQFVKVHPFFDPLRSDPRFEDLVRRVGLN